MLQHEIATNFNLYTINECILFIPIMYFHAYIYNNSAEKLLTGSTSFSIVINPWNCFWFFFEGVTLIKNVQNLTA